MRNLLLLLLLYARPTKKAERSQTMLLFTVQFSKQSSGSYCLIHTTTSSNIGNMTQITLKSYTSSPVSQADDAENYIQIRSDIQTEVDRRMTLLDNVAKSDASQGSYRHFNTVSRTGSTAKNTKFQSVPELKRCIFNDLPDAPFARMPGCRRTAATICPHPSSPMGAEAPCAAEQTAT